MIFSDHFGSDFDLWIWVCFESNWVFFFFLVKVITGVSDAELNNFDVVEGVDYERVTVEVVRMVSVCFDYNVR